LQALVMVNLYTKYEVSSFSLPKFREGFQILKDSPWPGP